MKDLKILRFTQNDNKTIMRKPILILTILIFVILSLFIARTVISNKISTSGVALGKTQDELNRYKTENTMLKEQIYALSSLSHVASAAVKTGFVESKANFAISPAHAIALKR